MACPAAAHLPRVERPSGEAAKWGDVMHAWKETGKFPTNTLATRRRAAALVVSGQTRDSLYPVTGLHEISYALHTKNRIVDHLWRPGLTREARESWKAQFGQEWITGTCDYTGDILGDPWVDDFKSGREVPDNPWDLWQLRFYATCVAMMSHADQVHVSLTHWPRYPADSHPRRVWVPEPIQRQEIFGVILPLLEMKRREVEGSWDVTDARPGDHCTWCDAKTNCKAYQAALPADPYNPFEDELP